jgi:hypothetical protein
MFEFSRLSVAAAGFDLPVRIELKENIPFVKDSSTVTLAESEVSLRSVGKSLPEAVTLCLVTNPVAWMGIPQKLKEHYEGTDYLASFFASDILPGWLKLFDFARDFIENNWEREPSERLKAKIKSDLAEDFKEVFKIRPELEGRWGW